MDPASIDRAIAELNRQFRGGLNLDRDVLISVLEIHQGNVQQTVQFLQAGEGDMVDPGPQNEGLPANYMTKPNNWVKPKAVDAHVDPESLEGRCMQMKHQMLSSETTFLQLHELSQDPLFVPLLLLLVEQGVEFPGPSKAKLLAVAFARKRYDVSDYLLARPNYMFGLPEVLRAVKTLDMPRRIRQVTRKIQALEDGGHAQARTLRSMRTRLADMAREHAEAQVTAANGALARRLRRWAGTIPREHLQFFALQMPKEPWRELADVCHFAPKDFAMEWFLPFVFGEEPPADSLLKAGQLTPANVLELVEKFHIPYSYLRKQLQNLSAEVRGLVASYEKLGLVIWYYEELECPEVDAQLTRRLAAGEDPELSYGKLMERILFMKMHDKAFYELLLPLAERRLQSIKLPLEPPVVVFGDASYSMDVAIRVSTIIASLLTVLADADIQFFNVSSFAPPHLPSTIPQVLDVALNTKADGLTATACTLQKYYDEKKPVKFFIMVTDEIENEPFDKGNGQKTFFAQLFYKYYMEVHPARLVMVSFLEDPNQKGRMVRALEEFGIVPLQFRLDAKRPDLTKLDSLLGILSAEANFFSIQAKMLAKSQEAGLTVAQLVEQIREGPEAARRKVQREGGNDNNAGAAAPVVAEASLVERFRLLGSQDGDVPGEFVCSITGEIMEEPVVAADGQTYEKAAILAWFNKSLVSPMTNVPLDTKMVFPNVALRGQILAWVEARLNQNKKE